MTDRDTRKHALWLGRETKSQHCSPLALTLIGIVVCSSCVSLSRAAIPDDVIAAQKRRIQVIESVAPSVVAIFADGGDGGGSGVLVTPDGFALTNFHVVSATGAFMKCGLNDGELYDAVIVGIDPTGDVALVKLLGRDDFPHAKLGDSDALRVGDQVLALGNPFLLATDFQPTVTYGMVSGLHRYQYPAGTLLEYADCIQVDASINPGNSGGPLFDSDGNLVGINGRISTDKRGRVNSGVGYAISINQIKFFWNHLRSGRIVDHATLGATVRTQQDGTIIVDRILDTSEAYRQGLRLGDEVVSFAGRPIRSANQFKNVLGIFPKGWRVPLVYRRDTQKTEVFVRLEGLHSEAFPLPSPNPAEPQPSDRPEPKTETPDEDSEKGKRPQPDEQKGPLKLQPSPSPPERDEASPPEQYKHLYVKKDGFANYYFNRSEQERLLEILNALGDFGDRKESWSLAGKDQDAKPFQFLLSDQAAALEWKGEAYYQSLVNGEFLDEPKGTGGLLIALSHWQRLLREKSAAFTEFCYLGSEPLDRSGQRVDVLVSELSGIEARWYFTRSPATFAGFDVRLADDNDPCEVRFVTQQVVDGLTVPRTIVVHHGDRDVAAFRIETVRISRQSTPQPPLTKKAAAGPSAASHRLAPPPVYEETASNEKKQVHGDSDTKQMTHDVIQSILPRLVKIYGAGGYKGLDTYSTGFLISADGHVGTIWNHVLDTDDITVVLNDGRRFPAHVVGAEPPLDFAVLKLQVDGAELSELPYFDLSGSASASAGTRVLAFSNMFGIASGDEPVSVVQGVVSAFTVLSARKGTFATSYTEAVYVVDAVTNNTGAGGGVVTTRDGRILGMIGKELRDSRSNTWVNYAIPAADLQSVARQIMTGQFTSQAPSARTTENPRRYEPIDFGLVLVPDVVYRTPAYIDSVVSSSKADEKQLRPDDLILFVNGDLIQSCREFRDKLGWLEAGDRLRLVVRRGENLIEVEFPVEKKE